MRTPTCDDLRFAADWLRQYDDTHDGGEGTAIAAAVAKYLDQRADNAELDAAARTLAVEHNLPRAKVRARLRQIIAAKREAGA